MATAVAVTRHGGWDCITEGDEFVMRGRGGIHAEEILARVRRLAEDALAAEHYSGLTDHGARVAAVAYCGPCNGVDGAPMVVERHDLEALAALGRFLGWLSGTDYDWIYDLPSSTVRRSARVGWTPLHPRGASKTRTVYVHDASGWRVAHCGHMTANWPYYATDPDRPRLCITTHNGLGWRTLQLAMEAVERVLAGEAIATTDRCALGVGRVVERGES